MEYVLYTNQEEYIVEYLFGSLITTKHISEAMRFTTVELAQVFQKQLFVHYGLLCSINTFIE